MIRFLSQRRHIPERALCRVNGVVGAGPPGTTGPGQVIYRSSLLDAAGMMVANVFLALQIGLDTIPGGDWILTGQLVLRSRGGEAPASLAVLGGGIYAQGSDVQYNGPGTYPLPLMSTRRHLAEAVGFVILCQQDTPGRVIEFTTDARIVAGLRP